MDQSAHIRALEEAVWLSLSENETKPKFPETAGVIRHNTVPNTPSARLGPYCSDRVVMLFPKGLVSTKKVVEQAVSYHPPWKEFSMEDVQVRLLDREDENARSAVITYRIKASCAERSVEALVSTAWCKEGQEWFMASHQQTHL